MVQNFSLRASKNYFLVITVKVPEGVRFGMKMYPSQPIKGLKKSCDWLRSVHFHAKNVHIQEL